MIYLQTLRGAYISSSKNHNKDNLKTCFWIKYRVITVSIPFLIYNSTMCSPFQSTIYKFLRLKTNLQEFPKIIVNSTMNIRSNLRSTLDCPSHPPLSPSPFRSSSIFQVVGLGQLPRLPETAEIVITSGVVVVFYSNYNTTPTKIMPINLQHFTRFSLKSTNSVDKKNTFSFSICPPIWMFSRVQWKTAKIYILWHNAKHRERESKPLVPFQS